MKKYSNIGSLLKAYRKHVKQSQVGMSQFLNIPNRTYRRWENNENLLREENIRHLSIKLKIPFEVFIRLNHGYDIFYDINTRQFKRTEIDLDLSDLILNPATYSTGQENGKVKSILSVGEIDMILEYDHFIYPTNNPVSKKNLEHSSSLMPELNLIVFDSIGIYVGHLVCFAIKNEFYQQVKEQTVEEGDLRIDDFISDLDKTGTFTLYVYSLYAASTPYALLLFRRIITFFKKIDPQYNSIYLAAYAVTEDGVELCKKLGMKLVFENSLEKEELNIDICPCLYEIDVKKLIKLVDRNQ